MPAVEPDDSSQRRRRTPTSIRRAKARFATALLDAGARTDLRDDLLITTPLGWACRWGRAELVQLLLERGADPLETRAESWATPRAWAEKMKHDHVLQVLLNDEAQKKNPDIPQEPA